MPHAGEAHLTAPNPGEFRWDAARGTAGFFRAAPDAMGRWWLVDALDRAFFCKAVHGVRASAPADGDGSAAPFSAANADPVARLRRWGCNAAGAGSDDSARADGLAFMATVDFCRAGPLVQAPGARLPDVFDPAWPRRAAEHARILCAPLATERALIGWLADDELGWAQPNPATELRAGATTELASTKHTAGRAAAANDAKPAMAPRPTLLQICLSLEPSFAAYHAAWEFVLALHEGKLASVARAWGVPLANKEVMRELTRAEQGILTRGYLRDHGRWTREFARRYFTGASEAIRAADPNHLVLGARSVGPASESVRAECVYPAVDVALIDWNDLPAPGPWGASRSTGSTDSPPAGSGQTGPLLADDVCWADEAFLRPSAGTPRLGSPLATLAQALRRVTTVERMLRRGRAALERAARHPAVVGYVWRQWLDEPGEQPPFARGLVHANGAEAREHTELLAEFNARAETVRRGARPSAAATENLPV